jgi:putative oxidoreductase
MKIPQWFWSPKVMPRETAGALLFLRLAFGYHLIQYAAPMVFSAVERDDFIQMLSGKGVPLPTLAGWLAIGTEFFGALSFLLGALIRPASALLIVNFVVALLLVHLHHPYMKSFEAIQLLAVSATLLGTGAGSVSLDALVSRWRAAAPQ